MQNQSTISNQSTPKDKPFFKFPERDLFSTLTGRQAEKMSVRIYPFIVDWQLTETEKKTESSQVQ